MKKNLILTFCFLLISILSFAGKFVMINVDEANNLQSLFDNKNLTIHYYCDDFVLASTDFNFENAVILDENAFENSVNYAIVYCDADFQQNYLADVSKNGKSLYANDNFLIMKVFSGEFFPAKNDGMIFISSDTKSRLTKATTDFPIITEPDDDILSFMDEVSIERMMEVIQRMQDYGTRYFSKDSSYAAQDWIQARYEELGLEVVLDHFTYYGYSSSANVIAIQYGTEFPDEFVVCGCHYDSINPSNNNDAPGADDNATGVAGILETARILSQHDFKRSIIYCSFSAEEVGLIGSKNYAQKCASQQMNIVGYFNIDMSGYIKPGTETDICLIFPNSAQPLADYYMNICNVYMPEIPVARAYFSGGDSDHTSFNNNGYMGIFPFENVRIANGYSPYIHTPNDLIGLSLNSPEQVKIYTKANLASVATLAFYDNTTPPLPLYPPTNCVAEHTGVDLNVIIGWCKPEKNIQLGFNVYRDDIQINTELLIDTVYYDVLDDYEEHCYNITAVYTAGESELSEEACISIPYIGIEKVVSQDVVIYPNPTNDKIYIESDLINQSIIICDINGRTIINKMIDSKTYMIDVSNLSNGIYFIKTQDKLIGKFIKE